MAPSPLLKIYAKTLPQGEAWLVAPRLTPELQLSLRRSQIRLYDGYSGRVPLNAQLLQEMGQGNDLSSLRSQLIFSRAQHILSVSPSFSGLLKTVGSFKFEGCYEHHSSQVCVYAPEWRNSPDLARVHQPRLRLDQDGVWNYQSENRTKIAKYTTHQNGVLDYALTGNCWIQDQLSWGMSPRITLRRALQAREIHQVEFHSGEQILEQRSKLWTSGFQKTYRIICSADSR